MNGVSASNDWLSSHQMTSTAMPTNIKRLRSRDVTCNGGMSGSRLPAGASIWSLLNIAYRNLRCQPYVITVDILTYPFGSQQGIALSTWYNKARETT